MNLLSSVLSNCRPLRCQKMSRDVLGLQVRLFICVLRVKHNSQVPSPLSSTWSTICKLSMTGHVASTGAPNYWSMVLTTCVCFTCFLLISCLLPVLVSLHPKIGQESATIKKKNNESVVLVTETAFVVSRSHFFIVKCPVK